MHGVGRHEPRIATVSGLLFSRRPFCVAGLVVSVVVYSVECKSGRSWPDVSIEVLEFMPPLADGDPAPTVEVVVDRIWTVAALKHAAPNLIFRRVGHAVCGSAATRSGAARFSVAGSQVT